MVEYRILHLEDSVSDADFVRRQLQKANLNFQYFWADDKKSFLRGLKKFKPDVILCDHSLPQFDSIRALELYRDMKLEIPFILVTGSVSEEYAVEMIKKGIDDYILKENLQRLPQAIRNAYLKREGERKMRLAEHQKEFDRKNLQALINNTNDLMWSVDKNFRLITSNRPFSTIIKLISGKVVKRGSNVLETGFSQEQLTRWKQFYERAFSGEAFLEIEHTTSPVESWSEISFFPFRKGGAIIGTACFSRNITKNKLAEEKLKKQFKALSDIATLQSHQVRAPIASILGLINLFKFDDPGDPENGEVLSRLQIATRSFDQIIREIVTKTNEIEVLK